jgi:hypothetical protein
MVVFRGRHLLLYQSLPFSCDSAPLLRRPHIVRTWFPKLPKLSLTELIRFLRVLYRLTAFCRRLIPLLRSWVRVRPVLTRTRPSSCGGTCGRAGSSPTTPATTTSSRCVDLRCNHLDKPFSSHRQFVSVTGFFAGGSYCRILDFRQMLNCGAILVCCRRLQRGQVAEE